MRWIHNVRNWRLRTRRSRKEKRSARFTASCADWYSFDFVRKNPFARLRYFLRRARRLVPRLTRGIGVFSCAFHRERSRNSFRGAAAIPAHGERHTARKRKRLHGVFRSSTRRSKSSHERCSDVNRRSGRQAHRGGLRSAWHSKKQNLEIY